MILLGTLSGCTQGVTGIFADIEQEEKIKTNNLVDNTFVSSVARADTGDGTNRYFAVAGTKIFARSVTGSSWSGAGAPSDHPVAQQVAAINGDELYGVFRQSEKDSYGIYRLTAAGWSSVYESTENRVTGIVGVDTAGDGAPDRLIATLSESDKRYLVVDPQSTAAVFHSFEDGSGNSLNGDDLGANRPVGKALVADAKLWMGRNALWYIDLTDLGNDAVPLVRVSTPANLGSFDYIAGETDGGDRLIAVTLDGDLYRSPVLSGATPSGWIAGDWEQLGSESYALSDVLWIEEAHLFLVSTITYGGRTRRGYFHATPNDDFTAVSVSNPGGNYRSTDLAITGISRIARVDDNDSLVFALTEDLGLWTTPSYMADQANDPEWRWE